MLITAESAVGGARAAEVEAERLSEAAQESHLIDCSAVESLWLVASCLSALYLLAVPIRFIMLDAPFAYPLATLALVNLVCLSLFAAAFREVVVDGDRAHRLLATMGSLVVLDFLVYSALVPSPQHVGAMCLIVVSSGFLILSTWRLYGVLALAVLGWYLVRAAAPTDIAGLSWPLLVAPAVGIALFGHHLRLRSIRTQAELLVESRRAEKLASAAAGSLEDALERQRGMEDMLRRELQQSDLLARIGRELLTTRDTRALYERVCGLTREVLDCDGTQTFIFREAEDAFAPVAGCGDPVEAWSEVARVRPSRAWMPGLFARLQREKWVESTLDDAVARLHRGAAAGKLDVLADALRNAGVRRFGLLALWKDDRMIGFQAACYLTDQRPTSDQIKTARGMAHLASLAIENANLMVELEHANALKSDFVSAVSHELRSPLNIMVGYNDLLLDEAFGPLSAEQRETLELVEAQAQLLLGHINETLDFGRLEAGRTVVELRETSAEEILLELENESQMLIEQRRSDVRVEVDSECDLPPLCTDVEKIKVVLKNLLSNALKFTPNGHIHIASSQRDGGIEFTVEDTGVGIPQDQRALVFEPFRQIQGMETQGHRGVGLGLHITKRFLDLLGGKIEMESEVGVGTTFRVWLPLRDHVV